MFKFPTNIFQFPKKTATRWLHSHKFSEKTLKKLCAQAEASVQADADAIKERIQKEHQSFEYVNKTVEQALWCEVIKFLEQSQQEPEIEQSTETPQESDLSTSSVPASAMPSADPLCSLQWFTSRDPESRENGRYPRTVIGAVSPIL